MTAAGEVRHVKMTRLRSPSQKALTFDISEFILGTEPGYGVNKPAASQGHLVPYYTVFVSGGAPRVGYPHKDAVNILWADGHVARQSMDFAKAQANRIQFIRDHMHFEGSLRAAP
ncbi:hypothetical protein SDC9_195819 [bioreactor metagenome]|uniref:Uncharacterized protein n=1 Tax=bioreactor metagenome TaxID=1076179 RepID=A0A645IIS9_9ZZZZ